MWIKRGCTILSIITTYIQLLMDINTFYFKNIANAFVRRHYHVFMISYRTNRKRKRLFGNFDYSTAKKIVLHNNYVRCTISIDWNSIHRRSLYITDACSNPIRNNTKSVMLILAWSDLNAISLSNGFPKKRMVWNETLAGQTPGEEEIKRGKRRNVGFAGPGSSLFSRVRTG